MVIRIEKIISSSEGSEREVSAAGQGLRSALESLQARGLQQIRRRGNRRRGKLYGGGVKWSSFLTRCRAVNKPMRPRQVKRHRGRLRSSRSCWSTWATTRPWMPTAWRTCRRTWSTSAPCPRPTRGTKRSSNRNWSACTTWVSRVSDGRGEWPLFLSIALFGH